MAIEIRPTPYGLWPLSPEQLNLPQFVEHHLAHHESTGGLWCIQAQALTLFFCCTVLLHQALFPKNSQACGPLHEPLCSPSAVLTEKVSVRSSTIRNSVLVQQLPVLRLLSAWPIRIHPFNSFASPADRGVGTAPLRLAVVHLMSSDPRQFSLFVVHRLAAMFDLGSNVPWRSLFADQWHSWRWPPRRFEDTSSAPPDLRLLPRQQSDFGSRHYIGRRDRNPWAWQRRKGARARHLLLFVWAATGSLP